MAPPTTQRYHDSWVSDVESDGASSAISEIMPPQPKWEKPSRSRSLIAFLKTSGRKLRYLSPTGYEKRSRRRTCWWLLIVFASLCFFGTIAGITYVSLVTSLYHRLNPPRTSSGLQHIVEEWKEPDSNGAYKFTWRDDFSRDIIPKACHSHNDYWRRVPFYEALANGCMGIEADIWLTDDGKDFLVSHSWKTTTAHRTLRSLYLDPLTNILENRNVSKASSNDKDVGVFDADPNASVVLLIDFKGDGDKTFSLLQSQLEPLRQAGWLTYFDGTRLIPGPLTIVGTGNTPFVRVQGQKDRFIFFDAPLTDISNPDYTSANSYYASVQMKKAVGHLWFNRLSGSQVDTIKKQIKAAADKGLKSRYWDTPSWPISLRDKVWFTLTENGVGMLNVDDLHSATRWNWNCCVIAGLPLCSKN